MGAEAMNIPFVDFSNPDLKPGSPEWNSMKDQVIEALIEYGCFEISLDKDSEDVGSAFMDALPEVFDLPSETKASSFFVNHFAKHPKMPLYEGLSIDGAPRKVESLSNLIWPQGNHAFCKNGKSYMGKLCELDQMIHRMISETFAVEQYMDELLENSDYHVRLNKYEKPQNNEYVMGLVPHTDKSSLTIVHANQISGLAVKTKDGRWIHVNPLPGHFVLILGDCLHAWTNGRLYAPLHQVTMSGNETRTRYSIAFSSIPSRGYLIKAPKELIDEENPLLFKPFDCVEYIANAYKSRVAVNPTNVSALKSYCGI